MRHKIHQFIQSHFFAIVLAVVAVYLSWANYTPGTWLSGWDTLHPEFDFLLNIKRLIFGVWREDQGLGAVAAHSHMSELPRVFILWLLSVVFPISILRYLYVFLCLILGPLGVYYFSRHILRKKISSEVSFRVADSFAFLGGLFYLLNLGTLQHFYIPFEMFTTQYAALGWLFLFATRYLETKERKDLLWFSIVTLLAAPQAYAATLFYVYLLGLMAYLAFFSIPTLLKRNFEVFKRAFVILLLTFTINSFWLLPNLYFVKNEGAKVEEAKINQLFSEEVFLKNQKFGFLEDVAIFKGYLYDWVKIDGGEHRLLFDKWINYQKNPFIIPIGFIAFAVIAWGILKSFQKQDRYGLYLLPLFIIPYFFLTGMNFPGGLYQFLQNHNAVFKEAVRMPWTKFSLLLMFSFSAYFAIGQYYLYETLRRRFSKVYLVQTGLWLILLIVYMYPAFKGELIGPIMRVKIPQEYFSAFSWINKQPYSGRIANFPSSSYAGWEVYRWGFQGAGFFWFGEKMPFLSRDSDRWISTNENYYHEVSYAVYSRNKELFEKTLDKYQVALILIDDSVLSQTTRKDFIYLEQLKETIKSSSKITPVATFGKLSLYQYRNGVNPEDYVFIARNLPVVGPTVQWNNYDRASLDYGYYLSANNESEASVYYPFRSLFTGRTQSEFAFELEDKGEYFSFRSQVPKDLVGARLIIPPILDEEVSDFNQTDFTATIKYPEIFIDGELVQFDPANTQGNLVTLPYLRSGQLEVRIPKIRGLYSYDSNITYDVFENVSKTCDQFNKGLFSQETVVENNTKLLKLTSVGSSNCLDIDLGHLAQRYGYLVTVENRNIEGKSLLISVINKNSQRSDLETYLPSRHSGDSERSVEDSRIDSGQARMTTSYFILPPMEPDAIGYTLHFDNTSIGRVKTVNYLGKITVNPIPYRFLTGIKILSEDVNLIPKTYLTAQAGNLQPIAVDHSNPSFYKVDLPSDSTLTSNSYLILSQSFDKGWKAYEISCQLSVVSCQLQKILPFLFAKEIKNHVLINNWENGWDLSSTSYNLQPVTIIIVYLPQYLEYIGFGLLFILLAFLFLTRKKTYPHGIKIEPTVN